MKKPIFIPIIILLIAACADSNNEGESLKTDSLQLSEAIEYDCKNHESFVFKKLPDDLKEAGFVQHRVKNWNRAYKNHLEENSVYEDSLYLVLPENYVWLGTKRFESGSDRETKEIIFNNTIITETVVSKAPDGEFATDIKIVQFLFENEDAAQQAIDKMKHISFYTIDTRGLKNPNTWWIHNCAIYFCRVRAAAFSFKPVIDAFEKRNGKVNPMRW
jgi:hypothetical protein